MSSSLGLSARLSMRRALPVDAEIVRSVLLEANAWLDQHGKKLWFDHEISVDAVAKDVASGEVYLAEIDGELAATLKFQLRDMVIWPDLPQDEACYVHRFAVRRKFAGVGVSDAVIEWVKAQTRALKRPFVRLECEAARPKLRAFYEGLGFRFHSEWMDGGIPVARYECALDGDSQCS